MKLKAIKRKLIISPLVKLARRYKIFRSARHIYKLGRNTALSYLYKLYKIDDQQIVFEVFMGRSYSDSPKALYEEMLKDPQFQDFKFVWVAKNPKNLDHLTTNKNTTLVKQRSPGYYKACAQSKYIITNSMLPPLVKKKKGQKFLQTWHGTPLKLLRLDLYKDYKGAVKDYDDMVKTNKLDTSRYDGFISPSKYCTKKFTSAFGLKELGKEDIIIEEGYPRNDYLFKYTQSDVNAVKKRFGIPKNKKVILYTPTWRDNQHEDGVGYTFKNEMDFDYMRDQLGDEYVILYRPHYFVANQFDFDKYKGFIYQATALDDSNDLYIITDMLITDYSSAFFDYAILGKPMLFFAYDIEEYRDNLRGFYFDMETLPGDITKSEKDIVAALKDLGKYNKKHKKAYANMTKKFNHLDDGNASKRVIDKFFNNNEEEK